MYNTLLYIGLTLMAVGFVGWVVSICMERHYEVKLWELEQKRKKGGHAYIALVVSRGMENEQQQKLGN